MPLASLPLPRCALASFLTALCLTQLGCAADEAPPQSLATFAIAGTDLRYALAIDPCVNDECPARVRLERAAKVLDTLTLEWPAPTSDLQEMPAGPGFGVGDVLGPSPATTVWTGDFDATGYAIAARPVRLSKDRVALLVTQRRGVEPVKRRHDVLVVDGDKLATAWTQTEGDGPTWTATRALPLREGQEEVLYAEGYAAGSAGASDQPDTLTVKSLRWNETSGRLVEDTVPDGADLQIVAFGAYATIAAAYEAKSACLFPYWILDASLYAGLPAQGFFIGAITSDAELAQAALAEAAQCVPPVTGSIVRYSQRR